SIRNVRRAMEFEFGRQIEVIENGGSIIQSTLNFDADKGTTSPMRTKEEANDYRYFPDPDLQPISISDAWLSEIKSAMPALPKEIAKTLVAEFGINASEANMLAEDTDLYQYFNEAKTTVNNQKSLVNWLLGAIRALLNEQNISIKEFSASPIQLATLINLVDDKKISQQNALQQLLPAISAETDVLAKANELNLLIVENVDEISSYIDDVLAKYEAQVQAYKNGKKGVLGLFVGEVMKLAKGKADAKKVNELIIERLK
ncbi:MAG: Asp-tRNA(Asn)/Glu-tRNA(Gln) amidotransferase GatCAB subunit B, partial [Pedobacter sp.]